LDRVPDKEDPKQPETVEADPVSSQERKREFGPIYLVDVPSNFDSSFSWKALPSICQKLRNKEIAKIAAIDGNQRLLSRSQDGTVQTWYAVVEAVGGFGIVQVRIPTGWKPADEYDMPKPFNVIEGRKERTEYLKTLNYQLDRVTNKKWRKRAYSALRVFRPETREDQPEAKPEPQAVPQTVPAEQNGHTVTVSGVLTTDKPVKRFTFTGELVSVSDPASTIKDDPKPETADALLKRHGLEIHQVDVDQQKKRLERYLSEMK
ncbi:MAG TPA: hypothetical protein DCM07_20400, partial [Planctomycetaceae bacterium]|nr:hypothetical protein [Planctomycetaceae bacterium]